MGAEKVATYAEVTKFHGHECPGSALGYRVAVKAMEWLDANRSEDEEIVAVVENDSCSVDAIQVVTGCTFGKGNLIFRDIGKRGYTFYNRTTGKGIRIVENYRPFESPHLIKLRGKVFGDTATDEERKEFWDMMKESTADILSTTEENILRTVEAKWEPPPHARLFHTLTCDGCGEKVMETRTEVIDGKTYCADCVEKGN